MLFSVSGCNGGGNTPACAANPIDNGDFELLPHETNNVVSLWDVAHSGTGYAKTTAKAVLTNNDPLRGFTRTYNPISGDYFALLKTGSSKAAPTSLSQTFTACAGDTIQGSAFFFTGETARICVNHDSASVDIYNENGNRVTNLFNAAGNYNQPQFGTTDWMDWSYTFTKDGTYRLVGRVTSADNNYEDSYF
ncbi:hypothetical protein [Inconstantimicrobium porci]|uniref:Uncharacterized protein n=1 Tax=Inconstantimicrobium porci TaxID=2652291 RepID=A0A7X2MZH4_9CLOT|nr:hypothetical protein [Inconstantimicrobium porci]MSR91944.1 hypothetical protein [Inconstantimicrobium porci]